MANELARSVAVMGPPSLCITDAVWLVRRGSVMLGFSASDAPEPTRGTDMKAIWIEFAAHDIDRANQFYSEVFGHDQLEVIRDPERAMIIIPGEPVVSLNQTEGFVPNGNGTLPYFDVEGTLSESLDRVIAAGGSIAEPTSERPGFGFFAIVVDPEGNHLYLHSVNR